jgi:iron complex transport system ATP-binding protein
LLSPASSKEVSSTVILAENLWCGYPDHTVLRGIAFSVEEGEFLGILGPNGSGKTTLLHALSGILPFQEGRIEILGLPLDQIKPKQRARRIAVVTQDSEVRFPFTCEEVVRMGRYPHRKRWQLDSAEDMMAVQRAMALTDTAMLADRLITAVSGGERQRVIMAKTLAQEAKIMLLDEATSAMDVHRKLHMFKVLKQLHGNDKLTVVAVMHDVNLAALFCHRMIFIRDGCVVADGPSNSVLIPEVLEEVYQTRVLIQEISDIGKRQVVFIP